MGEHKQNNKQFINTLMLTSIHGMLMEVFIIEAIRFYCEQVLKNPEPMDDTSQMINPRLWWHVAEEANSRIIERFEGKKDAQ